ncbi:6-phospho-3-hexuloisomerase [Amphibacillus sp. Q70]|uniref:6-phospho-3-hexuloisomerase n=1 Tax=Amphibacillus sp. Q70 TaxID=3453416 RepID=UPI003F85C474
MSNSSNMIGISNEIQEVVSHIECHQVSEIVNMLTQKYNTQTRVYCAGAGRSLLVMRAFAMRLMHLGYEAYVVGDVNTPAIGKPDVLIVGSGSGEISALCMMIDKAKTIGCKVIHITRNKTSSIAKKADKVLNIPIDRLEQTMQPSGSIFEQAMLVALDGLVLDLVESLALLNVASLDEFIAIRHANLE